METWGPPALASVIAASIAGSELITSKYARTWFLVLRDWAFYLYVLIYGVLGLGFFLGLKWLIGSGLVKLEGLGLSSPWGQAVAVGMTVRALLHITLFKVTSGSQSMPVGVETVVQIFEPHVLRTVLMNEFNAVRIYTEPIAAKYSDLAAVRKRIKDNIPPTLPAEERAGFENQVDKAATTLVALELFLRFLGRSSLRRVFPL